VAVTHIRPFQAIASPTLCAIMADTSPPAERARTMARQLDAMLLGGEFDRLNTDQRCSLRALVFGLDFLAEAIEAPPQPVPVRRSRPGWWWRVFG
jgi:hypothetical protein